MMIKHSSKKNIATPYIIYVKKKQSSYGVEYVTSLFAERLLKHKYTK